MTLEKLRRRVRPPEVRAHGDPPSEEGGSSLLEKSRGLAGVARNARARCQRGAEAERALHQRRNSSGQ